MKNIHLLPTDKPSRLCYDRDDNLLFAPNAGFTYGDGKQHLYITDDSEIKDRNCWVTNGDDILKPLNRYSLEYASRYWEKIILTTDQDLIADGVQAIDDEFLKWFIKNPSCEYADVKKTFITNSGLGYKEYAVLNSDFKVLEVVATLSQSSYKIGEVTKLDDYEYDIAYKIIISKEEHKKFINCKCTNALEAENCIINCGHGEEPKQETLEEAALNIIPDRNIVGWVDSYSATERRGFIKGAKYQAERMYSHEQVLTILEQFIEHPTKPGYKRSDVVDFIKKFKQQDK
jgi:hypothetical protein